MRYIPEFEQNIRESEVPFNKINIAHDLTCCGAINKKGLFCAFGSRRGLLAYVYSGVSLTMTECLSGGKWLLYSTAQCP